MVERDSRTTVSRSYTQHWFEKDLATAAVPDPHLLICKGGAIQFARVWIVPTDFIYWPHWHKVVFIPMKKKSEEFMKFSNYSIYSEYIKRL